MEETKNKEHIIVKTNQIRMIVEEMERNPLLNWGKLTPTKKIEVWDRLAQKLNTCGGAVKNAKCWEKYWEDKKLDVKIRYSNIKAERRKTKGGRNYEAALSALDERILLLIGMDAVDGLNTEESEVLPEAEVYLQPDTRLIEKDCRSQKILRGQADRPRQAESLPILNTSESNIPQSKDERRLSSILRKGIQTKVNLDSNEVTNTQHLHTFTKECNEGASEECIQPDTRLAEKDCRSQKILCESPNPDESLPILNTSESKIPQSKEERLLSGILRKEIQTTVNLDSNEVTNTEHLHTFTQECNEGASEECLVPNTRYAEKDCRSETIISEDSSPAESLPILNTTESKISQSKDGRLLSSILRKGIQTKSLVVKNNRKLLEGQNEMAKALKRLSDALETSNKLQERALEIKKRRADAEERQADAFVGILNVLKNRL